MENLTKIYKLFLAPPTHTHLHPSLSYPPHHKHRPLALQTTHWTSPVAGYEPPWTQPLSPNPEARESVLRCCARAYGHRERNRACLRVHTDTQWAGLLTDGDQLSCSEDSKVQCHSHAWISGSLNFIFACNFAQLSHAEDKTMWFVGKSLQTLNPYIPYLYTV